MEEDGVISPIDVFLVINRLLDKSPSGEAEFATPESDSEQFVLNLAAISPLVAKDAIERNVIPASKALPQLASVGAVAVVDQAISSVARGKYGIDRLHEAAGKNDEFSDLLDSVAADVATLWENFR